MSPGSGPGMGLAGRLAHREGTPRRGVAEASVVRPSPRRGGPRAGYVREAIELPVARRDGRPAALGGDLDALDLPTAPALARALSTLARMPAEGLDPRNPAVMLDLETTGLLGQAGTVACVVGVASYVALDRMRVEQWSLHRVGAEGAMLADLDATLRARMTGRTAFVTFNGGSFDLPLLRRRLVRHGIYPPTEDPLRAPHVDLLPPARRLWRDRGPDCRLGTLELRHLRLPREGDVSGAEVVELLWRWLEAPDPDAAADLARVERHNRIDVLSLAALAEAMHTRLLQPQDAIERLRAARHHDRLDRAERALTVLAPLLEGLERGTARGSSPLVEAGLLAAEIERRRGRPRDAARRWAQVCRMAPGDPVAHDALAKHLEHQARRPDAALVVALASVTPCERRLARLRKKAGGSTGLGLGPLLDELAV
ncbi:ribonuclease H-like domain-containing protein [Paraliomyxa miuraensis]|uniref:ribonuclease H-like domain-containing protein n=1 Tax=Paraliomyxa miuraensis TaxID=376150 RepID=UPI00225A5396|nr:ribonuclease H-like domain-containing protein [Paraliomyxa miuraensis]MCX4241065.1 ribonuclease H-like domain-containing protein [Paraliomyxa miuraensis]